MQLRLDGFEGPLDLLLDLARRQQVDLSRISILTLVDQYFLAASTTGHAGLARAADWLVMAAWLTWLKSRLLLPGNRDEAEQAAKMLTGRLAELDRVREVAAWLETQPQLGWDMFERGRAEMSPGPVVTADFLRLFQACFDVLRGPPGGQAPEPPPLPRRLFWSPHQAAAHMRAMLGTQPEGGDLLSFIPDLPDPALPLRGAIASTFVAGLELARDAQAELQQAEKFGTIRVRGTPGATVTDDAGDYSATAHTLTFSVSAGQRLRTTDKARQGVQSADQKR
jgi:segregation and condensation protein A